MNRTKSVLFQPFDFGKWLRLGFCAFLASLGEGGRRGSGNLRGNSGGGGQRGGQADAAAFFDFLREYALIIALTVIGVVVLGLALGILLQWLSSRGKFMFVDGVVKNRGAVVEPWRQFRSAGNSLFAFRFLLGLFGFVLLVLLLGGCALIALPNIQAWEFGVTAVIALVVAALGIFVMALAMAVIGLFLEDFVVPIMYHRRVRVMQAWGIFRREIARGNVGSLVVYFFFKIVIGLVLGVIALMAVCLTCCLAAIPYVGSVILLPLYVFVRCYSLYFLAQFGPLWKIIPDTDKPPKRSPAS